MIQEILEQFKKGKTYGLKIFVLPEDEENGEYDIIEKQIREFFNSSKNIMALGRARKHPYLSIRDALVNGYSQFVGQTSAMADLITISEEWERESTTFCKMVEKKAQQVFADKTIISLKKKEYEIGMVVEAIQNLCSKAPLVLYIRNAYKDREESINFLYEVCGTRLEELLGEHKNRLLTIFALRKDDLKERWGKDTKKVMEQEKDIQIVDLPPSEEERESLENILNGASSDELNLLRHIYLYCEAADTHSFPDEIIKIACQVKRIKAIEWLKEKDIIAPLSEIAEKMVWKVTDRYTFDHIALSIAEAEENQTYYEESEEEDDEYPVYEEPDPEESEEKASDAIYKTLLSLNGKTERNLRILFNLSKKSSRKTESLQLAGDLLEILLEKGNKGGLSVLLEDIEEINELLEYYLEDRENISNGESQQIKEGLRKLSSVLEKSSNFEWGHFQIDLANDIQQIVRTVEKYLPGDFIQGIRDNVRKNIGYLYFMNTEGRTKLLSFSCHALTLSHRNAPGTSCIRNSLRDGTFLQIQNVRLDQMAWLFCTNGNVINFPLSSIDAIYEDEADFIFENMSIFLGLRTNWREPSHYVASSCPFSKTKGLEKGHVLLMNEHGQAHSIPVSSLPMEVGESSRLDTSLLNKKKPARWSILIYPDCDLFVASSDNQVLRLNTSDLIDKKSKAIESILKLGEESKIVGVATLPSDRLLTRLLIVTEGGYGHIVSANEFNYGKIGDKGVQGIKTSKKNGCLIGIAGIPEFGHFILGTRRGRILRIALHEVPLSKRNSSGVNLMKLEEGDSVVSVCTY